MAKGDYIKIGVRGSSIVEVVEASQNGRRVELKSDKEANVQFIVATEITRGGTVVRKAMVPVSEVLFVEVSQKETA